jgi:hypothetical protein
MYGKPNQSPQDKYFIEAYNRDQNVRTEEPEGWRYFETESQARGCGWQSECDAKGRLYAALYLFRRQGDGWELMPPALRGPV